MPADLSTLDLAAEAERLGYVRHGAPGVVRWADGECTLASWHDGDCAAMWWEVRGGVALATEAAALRWLLDQPEARRLAAIVDAAEARGRKQSALDDDIAHYREHDACWALLAGWRTLTLDAAIPLALAEAEARGREAERADALAAIDAEREAPEPDLWRLAWRIQHGEHVGAADRAVR
jgi:hypothetical protein